MSVAEGSGAGRLAIVSGGTFGIGRGVTLKLAREGYRVVAFGLDDRQIGSVAEGGTAATRAALDAEGLDADLLVGNVALPADVERIVAHAKGRYGRIDALVNNAAIHPRGTILDTSDTVWQQVMDVNLTGPFLLSRAVLPIMIAAGGGAIVNIGSGSGWGKPNLLAYCASKGGIYGLTMAMAFDHLLDRVRVNLVIPGGTSTGMTTGEVAGPGFAAGAQITATGEVTQPEDLAEAIAFLLSPAARQISGTVLDVGCFAHQGGPARRPSVTEGTKA